MIPIQELRIGNMFWEDYGGYKIVTAIGFNNVGEFPNHVQGRGIGYKTSGLFDANEIDSIQLTPEILLACGFTPRPGSGVLMLTIAYEDGDYPCTLQRTGDGIQICRSGIGAITAHIDSLHQLMNLYHSLTNKELNFTQK
jgi:hypothetical protein